MMSSQSALVRRIATMRAASWHLPQVSANTGAAGSSVDVEVCCALEGRAGAAAISVDATSAHAATPATKDRMCFIQPPDHTLSGRGAEEVTDFSQFKL